MICRVRGTGHSFHGPGSRSTGTQEQYVCDLQISRAAYRNRTDDLRITRGPLPGRARASCTDGTDHRTDGTRCAGNIPLPTVVNSVVFSPDGKLLATVGDGTVQTWQLSMFADPYAALCADVGPPTKADWTQYVPGEQQPSVRG